MRTRYFGIVTIAAAMALAALLLALLVSQSNPALAQSTTAFPGTTITVNTEVDESNTDGDCSLREAIEAANTNLAVDGCAAGSATERDAIHFSLGKEATIVLDSELPPIADTFGLTINGQKAMITISGNDSVRVFRVNPDAKLTLNRLTVADGFATSPAPDGAGLFNIGGTVKVANSTFTGNSVVGVSQGALGGAIENNSGGTLEVRNSTFSNNSSNSVGGAINNSVFGTATITNSTFSGNSAEAGGAVFTLPMSTTTITNSTFSGNSATGSSRATIEADGSITLRSTIVANTTQGSNCRGSITDGGYNIDDDNTCNLSQSTSLPDTEPLLASSLANNGGPTQTIALLKGSPAINAIPPDANGCGTEIKTDQRGVKRPQGSGCDIGAYEKKVRSR